MEKVSIIVKVTPSKRHAFKRACLDLHTTMSVVLRDAINETIILALPTPAAMGKGEGDG